MKKIRISSSGFTLIEILVSTALLSILFVLLGQLIEKTMHITEKQAKKISVSSSARLIMNRLAIDFSNMEKQNLSTLVVIKDITNSAGNHNDALVLITPDRDQIDGLGEDFRCSVKAYRLVTANNLPELSGGSASICWSDNSNKRTKSNIRQALITAIEEVSSPNENCSFLNFQALSSVIFRLHVSFLLNNGEVSLNPPISQNFQQIQSDSVFPAAFSAEDSKDPKKLYVKAIIVTMGGLDLTTLQQISSNQEGIKNFSDIFENPNKNVSALNLWDAHKNNSFLITLSKAAYPKTALQNYKIFQRYYYVQ